MQNIQTRCFGSASIPEEGLHTMSGKDISGGWAIAEEGDWSLQHCCFLLITSNLGNNFSRKCLSLSSLGHAKFMILHCLHMQCTKIAVQSWTTSSIYGRSSLHSMINPFYLLQNFFTERIRENKLDIGEFCLFFFFNFNTWHDIQRNFRHLVQI